MSPLPRKLTDEEFRRLNSLPESLADRTQQRLAFLEALLGEVAAEWPGLEWAGMCQGEACCLFCGNETGWHGAENKHKDDCKYVTLAVRLRAAVEG